MISTRREIFVPGAGAPVSHYCDAVAAGNTLYVSGIVPVDEFGQLAGQDDVTAQAVSVFERLKNVLASQGATYADILKVTVFLTDINDRVAINVVRKTYFGDSRPASTLVEITRLAIPGAKMEVEAIALIPSA